MERCVRTKRRPRQGRDRLSREGQEGVGLPRPINGALRRLVPKFCKTEESGSRLKRFRGLSCFLAAHPLQVHAGRNQLKSLLVTVTDREALHARRLSSMRRAAPHAVRARRGALLDLQVREFPGEASILAVLRQQPLNLFLTLLPVHRAFRASWCPRIADKHHASNGKAKDEGGQAAGSGVWNRAMIVTLAEKHPTRQPRLPCPNPHPDSARPWAASCTSSNTASSKAAPAAMPARSGAAARPSPSR